MDALTLELRETGIVVMLGDQVISDLTQLRALAFDAPADQLAEAVAQLGPEGYEIITDPDAFRADYLTRLEAEDTSQPWQEGVIRLCDFGIPDFDTITAPTRTGNVVQFFARDLFTGLPYRAELDKGGSADPVYEPVELTPLPGAMSTPVPDAIARNVLGPIQTPDRPLRADPGPDDDDDEDLEPDVPQPS